MANGNEKLVVPTVGKIEGPGAKAADIPHDYRNARGKDRDSFVPLIDMIRKVDGGMQSHEAQDLKFLMYQEIDRLQGVFCGPHSTGGVA